MEVCSRCIRTVTKYVLELFAKNAVRFFFLLVFIKEQNSMAYKGSNDMI